MRNRLPADVLLLGTVVIWGINFSAVKIALDEGFEPLSYSSVRFVLAAAVFSAFTYAREGSLAVRRQDVWLLLGAAALGIWINQVTFVYGIALTDSASTVALLFGTLPIFVVLFAALTGVERLRVHHWIAAAISFGGVALVASGSGLNLGGELGGVLLTLAAAASWALYSLAMGPLMRRYSPYRISAFVLVAGSIPLVATAGPQLARQDWGDITALAWGSTLYAFFFALVVTNVLWFTAIQRVGAARSSLYANLQPFLGAAFAVVILSESMSMVQVAGGFVIGAGILLSRRPVGRAGDG